MAVLELVLAERLHGNGDVLLLALGIGKAKVHEFDLVFLDGLEHVGNGHQSLLKGCLCAEMVSGGPWMPGRGHELAKSMPRRTVNKLLKIHHLSYDFRARRTTVVLDSGDRTIIEQSRGGGPAGGAIL